MHPEAPSSRRQHYLAETPPDPHSTRAAECSDHVEPFSHSPNQQPHPRLVADKMLSYSECQQYPVSEHTYEDFHTSSDIPFPTLGESLIHRRGAEHTRDNIS